MVHRIVNTANETIGVYLVNGKYIELQPKQEMIVEHELKSKNPYIKSYIKKVIKDGK